MLLRRLLFTFILPLPLALGLPRADNGFQRREPGLIDLGITVLNDLLTSLDLIGDILGEFQKHPELSTSFPGLFGLLTKVHNDDIDAESYARGLLVAIQGHDEYKTALGELSGDLRQKVVDFVSGKSPGAILGKRDFHIPPSPAAKHHFKRMEEGVTSWAARSWLNAKRQTSPVIYEDEAKTKVMKVHVNAPFENWGLTVANNPAYTFVPTTVLGIQNLVKFAIANNKRVRASGYRHTWTPFFSQDNEILVSMLDLETVTTVPDPTSLLPSSSNNGNELKTIELASEDVPGSNGKKRLVRIGTAVTNEELRRWAIANNAWTMPMNVIMVEITYGGSNAPICHGGGIRHKTLSDLVREISYIDANGKQQSVSDPALLKAAAGSFGLLGIVTHLTLEFDKMTYAVMKPRKQPVSLAIPPPQGYAVPLPLVKLYTSAQWKAAREAFVNRATQDYYSEWFWFPYQQEAFINTWNNTEDQTGVIDYPTPPDVFLQWIQGWLAGVLNDSALFKLLPGLWQAVILGTSAHLAMPPYGPLATEIRTYLIDALHFRRGIQNFRVRDIELQIPIPPLASDPTKPDLTIVQKAWWDAISETYADPEAPMRVALELRMMADSDIIMAPQTNNTFGTASIEVLTTLPAVQDGSWFRYRQKVMDKWMALKDGTGAKLNIRPHWAKEWDGMTVGGKQFREYLKTIAYRDQIPLFKKTLGDIGASQGWTIDQVRDRFSNELLDYLFFS